MINSTPGSDRLLHLWLTACVWCSHSCLETDTTRAFFKMPTTPDTPPCPQKQKNVCKSTYVSGKRRVHGWEASVVEEQ